MLAGQLRHHPARKLPSWPPSWPRPATGWPVMRAENLSVAAAFDLSYQDLTAAQQRLFGRLGLVPGPDIDAYAAAALDETGVETARTRLDELYDHHLITEPGARPLPAARPVREYSRALAAEGEQADTRAPPG